MIKRRIYLINPKFQLRFAFFVCSLVFLCSLYYPWTIFDLIDSFVKNYGNSIQSQKLLEQRTYLILWLGVYQMAFIGIVFLISIFQSHKIAGPMYKLRKFLKMVADGKPTGRLFFRKGDNFPEVAEDFNAAFGKLQETYNNDFAYLSEVSSYINNLALVVPEDKKPVLKEISQKLTEIQSRFKEE